MKISTSTPKMDADAANVDEVNIAKKKGEICNFFKNGQKTQNPRVDEELWRVAKIRNYGRSV